VDLSRPLDEHPALMRMSYAAALLQRTTRTLYLWEAKGLIRISRPAGGFPLVPRSEVERLLREGMQRAV